METAQVVAIELAHGETWTYFADAGIYGLSKRLDLGALQRAVVEITAHARLLAPAAPELTAA